MKTQKQLETIKKQMDFYIRSIDYGKKNLTSPKYTINNDGTVDIHVGLHLILPSRLRKLPFKINYAESNLSVQCSQLTTLEGFPDYVYGNLEIGHNKKITSLEFAPKYVQGSFYCYLKNIKSLKYAPNCIGGNFHVGGIAGMIIDYDGVIDGNFCTWTNNVNIVNMPTVNGKIKMSDPDFRKKMRMSTLNAIINS